MGGISLPLTRLSVGTHNKEKDSSCHQEGRWNIRKRRSVLMGSVSSVEIHFILFIGDSETKSAF